MTQQERWAVRSKAVSHIVDIWSHKPEPVSGGYFSGAGAVVCQMKVDLYHANPSNPRLEPGDCKRLESFSVTAKEAQRWWLTWKGPGWCERIRNEPSTGSTGSGCVVDSGFGSVLGITLQPGECREITDAINAARAALAAK